MKIFACDLSSSFFSAAIYSEENYLGEMVIKNSSTHTENFFSNLKFFLEKFSLSLPDFDCFLTGAGPGSFTGLRIGYSIMKTFSYSAQKPLIEISSIKSLVYNFKFSDRLIVPVLNAYNNQVFAGIYRFEKNSLVTVLEEGLTTVDEIIAQIGEAPAIIAGDMNDKLRMVNLAFIPQNIYMAQREENILRASSMIKYALENNRISESFLKEKLFLKEPNYLKKSYAEISLEKRG